VCVFACVCACRASKTRRGQIKHTTFKHFFTSSHASALTNCFFAHFHARYLHTPLYPLYHTRRFSTRYLYIPLFRTRAFSTQYHTLQPSAHDCHALTRERERERENVRLHSRSFVFTLSLSLTLTLSHRSLYLRVCTYALPSIRLGERGAAKTKQGARKQQHERCTYTQPTLLFFVFPQIC